MRFGTTKDVLCMKVLICGYVVRRYVGSSSSSVVVMICEFQNGRCNRNKGTFLCFAKSQRCVTFSCSRLTDIGSMVCSNGQDLFVINLDVKNIFDTKNTCLGAC
jgi:hypothetical protein